MSVKIIVRARTAARTGTLGFGHVDGKTAFTTAAHGRAVFGAFGTSFGETVRATAYVGCARHIHVCARLGVHLASYIAGTINVTRVD